MELPIELRLATEKLASGESIGKMTDDAKELSRRYMNDSGTGKTLLGKKSEAAVYSLMRMPATYGAIASAIEQVCQVSDFVPRSFLDAGAGTGAGSWAANEFFKLDKITCLEREEAMMSIGKKLMAEASDNALKDARWIKADLCQLNDSYKADLVVSSYVLNEMLPEDRMKVVRKLWDNTEKMLIIIEPGTPVGFQNIRKIRDVLIEEGAYIAAPCPHMEKCPVVGDDWCHFTTRVQRGRIHKMLKEGDVPYEDEKYTYIAASRESCNTSDIIGRVMRHPIIDKGRVTVNMCTVDGIVKKTITKKDGSLYKEAKKISNGETLSAR